MTVDGVYELGDIVEAPDGKRYVVIDVGADGTVGVEPYTPPYVAPPPNRHERRAALVRARRVN